jgi:hypothetical protein
MPAKMLTPKQLHDLGEDLLGLQSTLARAALKAALENIVLLDKKQMDYGSENLLKHGVFGAVVRMGDKMSRIDNLTKKRNVTVTDNVAMNESIADSFKDMANYALIAFVMESKAWPTPPSNLPR